MSNNNSNNNNKDKDDSKDKQIQREANKITAKTVVSTVLNNATLQDYIMAHNRVDRKTDCPNGQHHFTGVGDPITKMDIIKCDQCGITLEEHQDKLRIRRIAALEKKKERTEKEQNDIEFQKEAKARTELAQKHIKELQDKEKR